MTDPRVFKFHIVLVDSDGKEYPIEGQRWFRTRHLAELALTDLPYWAQHLGLTVGRATVEDAGPGVVCNHAALCQAEPLAYCEHSQQHAHKTTCLRKCEFHDGVQCVEVKDD